MSKLSVFMFPLSPDYSGAASALFDIGGITVMHDASGCTGNYTGYDEPRWLGSRTATYCSGLRRMDAILGNDEKLIERTIKAIKDIKPSIVCFLGSPVPTLIGTDLKGMAKEVEMETGVPAFGFHTSGQGYYDRGASDVFLALTQRFCNTKNYSGDKSGMRVNILGMLPIDFGNNENMQGIQELLVSKGFVVNANYAHGLDIDQIRNAANADWNFVMSCSGLPLARYLEKKYEIPFYCGVPLVDGRVWLEEFERKSMTNADSQQATGEDIRGSVMIIHEQVLANSLRSLVRVRKKNVDVKVASLIGIDESISESGDIDLNLEKDLIEEINSGKYQAVIGDPELKRVIRNHDVRLIPFPHVAVSSKLHWDEYPKYLSDEISLMIDRALESCE